VNGLKLNLDTLGPGGGSRERMEEHVYRKGICLLSPGVQVFYPELFVRH
jgi:hypothetical protein